MDTYYAFKKTGKPDDFCDSSGSKMEEKSGMNRSDELENMRKTRSKNRKSVTSKMNKSAAVKVPLAVLVRGGDRSAS